MPRLDRQFALDTNPLTAWADDLRTVVLALKDYEYISNLREGKIPCGPELASCRERDYALLESHILAARARSQHMSSSLGSVDAYLDTIQRLTPRRKRVFNLIDALVLQYRGFSGASAILIPINIMLLASDYSTVGNSVAFRLGTTLLAVIVVGVWISFLVEKPSRGRVQCCAGGVHRNRRGWDWQRKHRRAGIRAMECNHLQLDDQQTDNH